MIMMIEGAEERIAVVSLAATTNAATQYRMKLESTRPTATIVSFTVDSVTVCTGQTLLTSLVADACTVGPPRCQLMKAMDEIYCPERKYHPLFLPKSCNSLATLALICS
jgi:hypothetical protein